MMNSKDNVNSKPKSLSHNFVVYLLKTIFTTLIPLIIFPYVSRILGTEGIGKVQYAQSIVTYFQLLAGLGISSYAIREGSKYRDDRPKLEKLSTEILIINLVSTTIAYVLFLLTIYSLNGLKDYRNLLLISSVLIFGNVLNVEWLYSIKEDYVYITVRSILLQLVSLVLIFLFVRTSNDYHQYALILVLPVIASAIVNLLHSRKHVRFFGKKNYNIRQHFRPILLIFGISLASTIYMSMDTTMLGAILGDNAVGLYTAASKLSKAVSTLVAAICTVFLPRLSYYAASENTTKFQNLVATGSNIIIGLSIPAGLGLCLASREGILLFSGAEFIEAVPAMRVLSINLIFSAINGFLAWQILVPLNQEKIVFFTTITSGLLDFVLNYFLIPLYGPAGGAFSTLLSEVSVFLVCAFACSRYFSLKIIFKDVWQYFIGSILFIPIYYFCSSIATSAVTVLGMTIVFCIPAYIITLFVLKNKFLLDLIDGVRKKMNFLRKNDS